MTLLADIDFTPAEIGLISLILGPVVTFALWAVKAYVADLTEQRNSWRNIALSSLSDQEVLANRARTARGQKPLEKADPVVPESSSPPSKKQKETASIATARETQVFLREELGLPQRQETDVLADMTETMKDQVDDAVEQIKDTVEEAGEATKDKIDEIG